MFCGLLQIEEHPKSEDAEEGRAAQDLKYVVAHECQARIVDQQRRGGTCDRSSTSVEMNTLSVVDGTQDLQ